ncbi:LytTR family DNA-binding domain-containing protein [Bacillus sp. V5-8f]|uniref:LytR/AlgR family response regulator transcription factor n=1 Tax=Bacillus sp. V5-8f TaxID=2053044 RepID=UPI000C786D8D|nr:LytTR family DNA-binding domain-containing protein [Bacillus sp. V5-8f]PLT34450.1 DNA-binding response regulator [Bacillus sp. V5-8f]
MNILIAEDDPSSRKLIKHFIESIPNYKVTGEAVNGEELIRRIVTDRPDVALVDIGMPLLNGMEAIKSCKELFPDLQVIFITGNDEYALEAFDVSAIDYILKPIERTRLYAALERAGQVLNKNYENEAVSHKNLMIKQQNSITFIPFEEIYFIERTDRKSLIHTIHNKIEAKEALTSLEKLLDTRFMASHRSYIINLDYLSKIEACGQMYIAYFKNYRETAKISKHKLSELQYYKSI